jgi:hypothetical protein
MRGGIQGLFLVGGVVSFVLVACLIMERLGAYPYILIAGPLAGCVGFVVVAEILAWWDERGPNE